MVTISCSGKLHAFALAEQLEKNNKLDSILTTYAYQKNTFFNRFVKRIDKEEIPTNKIKTNILLAFPIKLWPGKVHIWNNLFDLWVAKQLEKSKSKVFIGWSGMSLHSIYSAKNKGMKTILERGSTHIVFQNEILKEEYKKFNIDFAVHPAVIEKELKEYEEADYITVPSTFVKKTFIDKGVPEHKILMNPYGAGKFFRTTSNIERLNNKKFTIVYLGTLSFRKGLIYLFEALTILEIPLEKFQVWFIGSVEPQMQAFADKMKKSNWKFLGQIDHYDLQKHLIQCDVGVQPSLEEGLSLVIPQMMACGVPVIVTPNSGGENIITNEVNGFVVNIRNPKAIADKIEFLYQNRNKLQQLKEAASNSIKDGFKWDDYGSRYINFLNEIV